MWKLFLIAPLVLTIVIVPELGSTASRDVFRDQILPTVPQHYSVIAYLPCSVLGPVEDVSCLVLEKSDRSKGEEPLRVLRMYRIERAAATPIFEYQSHNPLDSVSMINRTTLMVIWTTGSGYQYTVFRRVKSGEVRLVLDSGGRAFPEVADLEDDGVPEILITNWKREANRPELVPTNTTVYRFKADRYVQARIVPWADRFRAAGKPAR